jgi:hypothetical protein
VPGSHDTEQLAQGSSGCGSYKAMQQQDVTCSSLTQPIHSSCDRTAIHSADTWQMESEPRHSQPTQDTVSNAAADGYIGTHCCWALMNICSVDAAQVQVAHEGLFTLLDTVKSLSQSPRGRLSRDILRRVQWHCENVTLFYSAELKIKVSVILRNFQVRIGEPL